jgi:alpha-glucosidase
MRYIKTGYVSPRMDNSEFHSSQVGVRHYQKTVELAAARGIMLDIHEPVKGTGIERTWPNLMTREGVMGQEYEGGAIMPEHTTTLPFTRLLSGPLDYTPGLFNLNGTSRKVQTTLAKQLAFYVTMYSPMQMAADLPEHYAGQPAFQFIKDVPVNWEVTVPLDGVIGDYYVVARKDRTSDDWYVGAVTDEHERTLQLLLNFLPEHRTYQATLYGDAPDAHWQTNPEAITITTKQVSAADTLELFIAPGGGFAIHLSPEGEISSPYPSQ